MYGARTVRPATWAWLTADMGLTVVVWLLNARDRHRTGRCLFCGRGEK